jgi:hypothetical protein
MSRRKKPVDDLAALARRRRAELERQERADLDYWSELGRLLHTDPGVFAAALAQVENAAAGIEIDREPEPTDREPAKVIDMMVALKASLGLRPPTFDAPSARSVEAGGVRDEGVTPRKKLRSQRLRKHADDVVVSGADQVRSAHAPFLVAHVAGDLVRAVPHEDGKHTDEKHPELTRLDAQHPSSIIARAEEAIEISVLDDGKAVR